MNYTIRLAKPADAPGIIDVARHTWNLTYAQSIAAHNRQRFLGQAYTQSALEEAIRQAGGWFYVAAQSKTVVGFAQYLRRFDAQGELVRIYVHPGHQRRSIGSAFLEAGLNAMASEGIGRCHASVEVDNRIARAFYERYGFSLHREFGRFLGDQIIRLVEYVAPIASLLDTINHRKTIEKGTEQI
ncbi:MAG: GNAT family N-acetyltransferase [Anaerolineales bacterium]|nr:MAG: GNAT family N-acetyltransferase [Anaerolineales bacterium]